MCFFICFFFFKSKKNIKKLNKIKSKKRKTNRKNNNNNFLKYSQKKLSYFWDSQTQNDRFLNPFMTCTRFPHCNVSCDPCMRLRIIHRLFPFLFQQRSIRNWISRRISHRHHWILMRPLTGSHMEIWKLLPVVSKHNVDVMSL